MNPFDLIVTDLDGTFLTDDKRVPSINAHAVRVAAERGIPTVYATGRPPRWLDVLDPLADTHGWAVAANGALTLDLASGRLTHARPLSPDPTIDIIEQIRTRLPSAIFAVEYADAWGAEPHFPTRPHAEVPDLHAEVDELFAEGDVVKLLVLDASTPTDALAAAVFPLVADRLAVTFSHVSDVGMLEISAPGVSKALALTELLADLGIDASRMIAFGDMPNDLEMLALAGQGFLMDNCHPSMLETRLPSAGDNNDAGMGRTVLRLLGESPGTG